MTYPYIGKTQAGSIVIFHKESTGRIIKHVGSLPRGRVDNDWEEFQFTNITAEYLANTCGEVKSKEHAHFIVRLGEGVGYELCGSVSPNDAGQFIFDAEHKRLYFTVDNVNFVGMKQITIPLPPKKLLMEFEEREGEVNNDDEWPKVGSSVEWGHTGKGEVKSLSDGFAWIKLDNKDYTTVYVSSLRKPKTQEQELLDEISDLAFNQFNDDSYDLTHNAYYLAEKLISKYDIKKKPQ